jgi:hypothetical protein
MLVIYQFIVTTSSLTVSNFSVCNVRVLYKKILEYDVKTSKRVGVLKKQIIIKKYILDLLDKYTSNKK